MMGKEHRWYEKNSWPFKDISLDMFVDKKKIHMKTWKIKQPANQDGWCDWNAPQSTGMNIMYGRLEDKWKPGGRKYNFFVRREVQFYDCLSADRSS